LSATPLRVELRHGAEAPDKEMGMDTVNTLETSTRGAGKRSGILYPVLLIAAIAVILFSALGIATMMGWMPTVLSGGNQAMTPDIESPAKAGAVGPRQTTGAPPANAGAARPRVSAAASCSDCGVVDSIRVVEVEGQGSGVGVIGGAVVGGILGNQVGHGRGRTAATVVGAGAGAYAGNEIEKNAKKSTRYQVRVRMNDGTYRTFHEATQPALGVGQKVRVTEQGVVAAG
jgi:outer membrane lipoprotein SlyB